MEYGGTTSEDGTQQELKRANIFFTCVFLFVSIYCFVVFNTGEGWLVKFIKTNYTDSRSIGSTLVSRASFSLAVWFAFHSIVTIGNPNLIDSCQFQFHIYGKYYSLLLLVMIYVGTMFIGDSLFDHFLKFAMYASGLYLVIQVLFLIDLFHRWNDTYATEDNVTVLLIITFVLTVGGLGFLGICYHFFGFSGCGQNTTIITVNICLTCALWFASLLAERGSIFTASLVTSYISYLTCTGLMCDSTRCNKLTGNTNNYYFSVVSSIFTLSWAGYSAFSTTYRFGKCDCENCEKEVENAEERFSLSFFHGMFAFASIYLCMLVTSWGKTNESTPWSTSRGSVAKWVNIGVSWLVQVLYGWTLAAPKLLKDRVFD